MLLRLYLLAMTIVGVYCSHKALEEGEDILGKILFAGGGFAWGCAVFNLFALLFLASIAVACYITTGRVPDFLLKLWYF